MKTASAAHGWRAPGSGTGAELRPIGGTAAEDFVAGEAGSLLRIGWVTAGRAVILVPGLWVTGKLFDMPLTGGKLAVASLLSSIVLSLVEVLVALGRQALVRMRAA